MCYLCLLLTKLSLFLWLFACSWRVEWQNLLDFCELQWILFSLRWCEIIVFVLDGNIVKFILVSVLTHNCLGSAYKGCEGDSIWSPCLIDKCLHLIKQWRKHYWQKLMRQQRNWWEIPWILDELSWFWAKDSSGKLVVERQIRRLNLHFCTSFFLEMFVKTLPRTVSSTTAYCRGSSRDVSPCRSQYCRAVSSCAAHQRLFSYSNPALSRECMWEWSYRSEDGRVFLFTKIKYV